MSADATKVNSLTASPPGVSRGATATRAESILVIRHGAFGDILQAQGALQDIRAHHPQARITMLVAPPFRRLVERCPFVDDVILDERARLTQPGRTLALAGALRARGFERVYDLQGSDRTRLYRWLMPNVSWSRRRNRRASTMPDRVAYREQLQRAGIVTCHAQRPDTQWMVVDVSELLAAAGIGERYVVLVPGSAMRHRHKRWPHYAGLADRLTALGLDVVVAPGPDEIDIAQDLPCQVLMGPGRVLDWFELAGVLRGASFVIGNDTGPTHLASCLGRPGIAVFGPHASAQRTGILNENFEAIEAPDLARLSVDEVMARVAPQLN